MNDIKKELKNVRKCFVVIEGYMRRLIRLGSKQDRTGEIIGRELQRQAKLLEQLSEQLNKRA